MKAHKPQPSSCADQTDQEEAFSNCRPSHHILVAFNAIFSMFQCITVCFPEPTVHPDAYLSVCMETALHAEELTRYKLTVMEAQAFLHILISEETKACADHLILLATIAISFDKRLWVHFELSIALITSCRP